MNYYYIESEVAGGLGQNTVMDTSTHPPIISKLHYEFDGWMENDIVESFPCFIVTSGLKRGIESNNLSGCKFGPVEISVSDQFKEIYGSKSLPDFYWLEVNGVAGKEDFGLAKDHRLVISEQTFRLFQNFNISMAIIQPYEASI